MFDQVTVRGAVGELVWGYRSAATLRRWTITRDRKDRRKWRLSGVLERADRFQCSQAVARKELLFTAIRGKGRWCWPLEAVELGTSELRALLGQPLQ